MFLQEVGESYDRARSMKPFGGLKDRAEILKAFGGDCCYCATHLDGDNFSEDHLIGLNKSALGLHAWGNVVPSCRKCNKDKQGRGWREHLASVAVGREHDERASRIEQFQKQFRYSPNLQDALREVADALYEEIGGVSLLLINLRIKRAERLISAVSDNSGPHYMSLDVSSPRPSSARGAGAADRSTREDD